MDEKLIFQTESQQGKEVLLSGEELTFGRDPECTVVIDDIQISRHHLRIYRDKQNWLVEDLKSTNGSSLNGKALKRAQKLKNGDLLTMGEDITLKVVLNDEKAEKETRKAEKVESSDEKAGPRKRLSFKREKVEAIVEPDVADETPVALIEEETMSEEKDTVKFLDKYPKWAIILMIAIAFVIVFCVIPLVVIEVSDQWCNLFSGFFNSVIPNTCP